MRRILSAGGLLLVAILSAEVTARVDDFVRLGVPLTDVPDLNHNLTMADSLGVRGRPNGRYQRWKLNSAGFRSPESVLSPDSGCTRVMILGSSETFGAGGESPNKEYPAQLSDSLNARGCYQVINAAIVGISLPVMIQLWNSWASGFHGDIVVILANPMFYLGDKPPQFPVPSTAKPAPPSPWWTPRLISKAHQAFHWPDFIQRRRVERQLAALTAGHPPEWFFESTPTDRLDQYGRDLDSAITTIRSHGATPIVAAYPMRFGDTLTPLDREMLTAWRQYSPKARPAVMLAFANAAAGVVRDVGRRRNVPVADLSRTMNGRQDWFDDFVHYTDAGAGVVAGLVAHEVLLADLDRRARLGLAAGK
jgi:hypothetical protein